MRFVTFISIATMSVVMWAVPASAQAEYKLGKVTRAELERTEYPDVVQGADAVVLEDINDLLFTADSSYLADYDTDARYFACYHRVIRKIKILNDRGIASAHVKFAYHRPSKPVTRKSEVSDIKGFTYTMEDGKMVRRKLRPKDVSVRMVDDSTAQVEFSLPDVRAGSIVEYEYLKFSSSIRPYSMSVVLQRSLPILNSRCDVWLDVDRSGNIFKTYAFGSVPLNIEEGKYRRMFEAVLDVVYPEPTKSDPFAMRNAGRYRCIPSSVRVPCWMISYTAQNLSPLAAAPSPRDISGVRIAVSGL